MSLSSFPEELLERIFAFYFSSPQCYQTTRSARGTKLSLLLVSQQFHRIARPLLYHTISIHLTSSAPFSATSAPSTGKLTKLLHSLRLEPCPRIHTLHIAGLGSSPTSDAQLSELIRLCAPSLTTLDVSFHSIASTWQSLNIPDTLNEFCYSLAECVFLEDLTLRKTNGLYMTAPFVRAFVYRLADVVRRLSHLKMFYLAFRPSDERDSANNNVLLATSASKSRGPLLALTSALATLPQLETFVTHLPTVWNEVLLGLSGEYADASSDGADVSPGATTTPVSRTKVILLSSVASHVVGVCPLSSPPSSPHISPYPMKSFTSPTRSNGGSGSVYTAAPAPTPSLLQPPRGLYMASARKYPKLWKMIQAGEEHLSRLLEMPKLHQSVASTGSSAAAAARGRSWTWAAPSTSSSLLKTSSSSSSCIEAK